MKLNGDNKVLDHDKDDRDTAQGQCDIDLVSEALTQQQLDIILGVCRWHGIRRRGIWQNGKVRGIDNDRSSGTNMAAWLQDSIMTTPHDIAIQVLCW